MRRVVGRFHAVPSIAAASRRRPERRPPRSGPVARRATADTTVCIPICATCSRDSTADFGRRAMATNARRLHRPGRRACAACRRTPCS